MFISSWFAKLEKYLWTDFEKGADKVQNHAFRAKVRPKRPTWIDSIKMALTLQIDMVIKSWYAKLEKNRAMGPVGYRTMIHAYQIY